MEANGPNYRLRESKRRLKQNRPDTDNPPDHEQDDRQVDPNWQGSVNVLKKQVGKYLILITAHGRWIAMASLPFRPQLPTYPQWFREHCPWSNHQFSYYNRLITNLQPLKADSRQQIARGQQEKTGIVRWFGAFHEVPPKTSLSSTISGKESQRMALLFILSALRAHTLMLKHWYPPLFPINHTPLFLAFLTSSPCIFSFHLGDSVCIPEYLIIPKLLIRLRHW